MTVFNKPKVINVPTIWNKNSVFGSEFIPSDTTSPLVQYFLHGYMILRDWDRAEIVPSITTPYEESCNVIAKTAETMDFAYRVVSEDRPHVLYEKDGKTVRSIYDFMNALVPYPPYNYRGEAWDASVGGQCLVRYLKQTRKYNLFGYTSDIGLASVAEYILGSRIRVYQSHINFKRAFTGGDFAWHSDFTFWHYDDGMRIPRALSVMVFLDDVTAANGPLMVIPGSHRTWFPRDWSKRPENVSEALLHDSREGEIEYGLYRTHELQMLTVDRNMPVVPITGKAGDVVFMDGNLVHASGPNLSDKDRRIAFVVLNSEENPLDNPYGGGEPRPEWITQREGRRI